MSLHNVAQVHADSWHFSLLLWIKMKMTATLQSLVQQTVNLTSKYYIECSTLYPPRTLYLWNTEIYYRSEKVWGTNSKYILLTFRSSFGMDYKYFNNNHLVGGFCISFPPTWLDIKTMFKPLHTLWFVFKKFVYKNNSTKECLNYVCISGNIALGKTATSGPVYSYRGSGRAVDGNTNPNAGQDGSCFHHDWTSGTAWWMVDLGVPHVIYNVTIYNQQNYGTCSVLGSLNVNIISFLNLILLFVFSLKI